MTATKEANGYEDTAPCPVCKEQSIYSRRLDRYFDTDGSDNAPCWLAILRGEITA